MPIAELPPTSPDRPAIRICHDLEGPSGAPVVVLVNGMGGQMIGWPPALLEPLRAAGVQVLRYDNRDVGESTWLDDLGPADIGGIVSALKAGEVPDYPYTLRDMVGDLVGLLDHLDIPRAHVVGPSMGGMIVQRLAIDHPDRVASLTSVMSTTGDHRLPGPAPEATRALLATAEPGLEGYLAAKAVRRAAYGSRGLAHDEAWDRDLAARLIQRGINPDGGTRHYAATIADGDRTAALRDLDVPALVVHGSDDTLIRPTGGQATADAIPGARFRLVEGMGHDLPPAAAAVLAEEVLDLVRTA